MRSKVPSLFIVIPKSSVRRVFFTQRVKLLDITFGFVVGTGFPGSDRIVVSIHKGFNGSLRCIIEIIVFLIRDRNQNHFWKAAWQPCLKHGCLRKKAPHYCNRTDRRFWLLSDCWYRNFLKNNSWIMIPQRKLLWT